MRDLRFRAWDRENKLMTKPRTLHWLLFDDNNSYMLDRDLVWLQYTGLKDKNGVEIYEGDIVRYNPGNPKKYKAIPDKLVKWQDADAGFNIRYTETREVIGNIYENPELLATEATQ